MISVCTESISKPHLLTSQPDNLCLKDRERADSAKVINAELYCTSPSTGNGEDNHTFLEIDFYIKTLCYFSVTQITILTPADNCWVLLCQKYYWRLSTSFAGIQILQNTYPIKGGEKT